MTPLLIGVAGAMAGAVGAPAGGGNAGYFPLRAGGEGGERGADHTGTQESAEVRGWGKVQYRMDTLIADEVRATEVCEVRRDGVYRVKVNADTVIPPVRVLAFPIRKGDSWDIDSRVGGQPIKGTFTVADLKA